MFVNISNLAHRLRSKPNALQLIRSLIPNVFLLNQPQQEGQLQKCNWEGRNPVLLSNCHNKWGEHGKAVAQALCKALPAPVRRTHFTEQITLEWVFHSSRAFASSFQPGFLSQAPCMLRRNGGPYRWSAVFCLIPGKALPCTLQQKVQAIHTVFHIGL